VTTRARELRRLTSLATPVVITQVGMMTMGMVDVIMIGHVGVEELAAASLGRVWLFGTLLMAFGVVIGIDPIVAQAHGRRDAYRLGLGLQQGLVVAAGTGLLLSGLWFFTEPMLNLFGQDPELARMARGYVWVQIPTTIPVLFYVTLRHYLQGRGIVKPAMWVTLGANGANVFLNWVLIYGNLGAPELGLVGAGIATGCTRTLMFVALLGLMLAFRFHQGGWTGWNREALRPARIREVLHFGIPVSLHTGLEVWAFQAATLLSGRLGTEQLAAHVITLTLASFMFMFPLGISFAAVTRVGNLIGENREQEAQTSAWVALGMGAAVMSIGAVIFVLFRDLLPLIYTGDRTVAVFAASALPIAAAFQMSDGIQVVATGILRGMGRTRPAAVFNFIGYWVLAIPLAWWLSSQQGWGLRGIWWGLALGLGVIALLLVIWIAKRGPASGHVTVVEPEPGPP
jgi:MATE family multidrug resistance protein